MSNINNVYKCKCSAICSKNPNGFDVVSRASYYNHMNNDIPLSNEDSINFSFAEDNMDVDDSYEDAYDEFEFAQVHDDSNEEESNEGEDPFTRFTYESGHPTEPLALVFFMTLLIFQGKYLNEEGIEILMQCFNEALKIAKCEYRFPTRANTFRDWCQISKFVYGGLQHFVSCITCHAIYPFQTDEEKERTMSKRKCSSRNSSLDSAGRCHTPLFGNLMKPLRSFYYNSVINTLKTFFLRDKFVNKINKWKSRAAVPDRLFDIWDGRVWNEFKMDDSDSIPFVHSSNYNLLLTMNVDWFQLYSYSQYSCGAVYLTIQNLPREERNLRKNVILVGLLPGPTEPSTIEMNNYLNPLVEELLLLKEGVGMQTKCNGLQKVRAALTLVTMDLPAQRKCLGFTSHSSAYACHKCDKKFEHLPNDAYRRNFSDFNDHEWVHRTNVSHRVNAERWLSASTLTERIRLEKSNGTRWSSLLRLSYFDPVRFAPVDVMHNCFLGTAKRLMQKVWRNPDFHIRDETECIITRRHLVEMSELMENLVLPIGYDGSSIARKILVGDGFSYMKADEWKVWITLLSPFLLSMRMKPIYLDHWMLFVKANEYLASTSISKEEVEVAHSKLKLFLEQFSVVYGNPGLLTINSHNHLHIRESILNYGPAMSHWLFNFERYNCDLKGIVTNKKGCVEHTLMKKFLSSVHDEDFFNSLPELIEGQERWRGLFCGESKRLGSGVGEESDDEDDEETPEANEEEEDDSGFNIRLFLENEESGDERLYGYEYIPSSVVKSVKVKLRETTIDNDSFRYLVAYYNSVYFGMTIFVGESALAVPSYNDVEGRSVVSRKIWKFPSLSIFANHYRSVEGGSSKNNYRGSYASIYWDDHSDRDGNNSSIRRPAQILYFFCHEVKLKGDDDCWSSQMHVFAMVR